MVNFSIVIPYYNMARTLPRLLRSVGKHGDVEVIVVNDKSDRFLTEYEEIRGEFGGNVSFLENDTPVKSAGAARNVGMSAARGRWLLFADADDYFTDGWYDAVEKYADSDCDVVFFPPEGDFAPGSTTRRRGENYVKLCRDFCENKKNAEDNLRIGYYSPDSKIVRKSFAEEHGISFDEILCANDVMFSMKAGVNAKKIDASEDVIYYITSDSSFLTTNTSLEAQCVRVDVCCRRMIYLREMGYKTDLLFPLIHVLRCRKSFGKETGKAVAKVYRSCGIPLVPPKLLNPFVWVPKCLRYAKRKGKQLFGKT